STPCTCADALVAIKDAITIVPRPLSIFFSVGAKAILCRYRASSAAFCIRSPETVHSLSIREGFRATGLIALLVEALGPCQRGRECRLCPPLGPPDRIRRRLAASLCTNSLLRSRPCETVPCRLAHRLLELRDRVAAGAGVDRCSADEQDGGDKGCGHFHDVIS